MGEAMVKRLTKAGHAVEVWNRTAAKAAPLAEYGAVVVDSKQDLAACDTVFTMVSTTNDLKDVLFGEGGLVAGAQRPRVVIDSSSISQEGSAEIRAKLEALGIAYLCAPVSGNAKVAKAGKLLVVASGPNAIYDEAEPLLAAMSRKAMWVGEGELARVWKIAHNTMFGVIIQNLCEITVLAEKAGIPRDVFLESINDSVLGSMYTRYKTPVLTKLNFEQVTFTPKLLLKDMDLGLGAAKVHGVAMCRSSGVNTVARPACMCWKYCSSVQLAATPRNAVCQVCMCALIRPGMTMQPVASTTSASSAAMMGSIAAMRSSVISTSPCGRSPCASMVMTMPPRTSVRADAVAMVPALSCSGRR
jgi:3-hydroxyisobutyrate dehydrogenase